ncbi:HET domain-containing protein [Rutstroemia sp. NJR-2017a WRK4]|nr:HET domain-containing protein [Rutstroemia sp. NJR-2017a WRK4]
MRNEDRQLLTVDYGRTLGVVYAEAIAHIFQKGTGPYLLSGLELAGKLPSDPSLPSWVPELGSTTLTSPIRYHPPGVGVSGAGSGAKNGIVDPDLKTLRVRGMHIDIVYERERFGEGKGFLAQFPRIEALVTKAHELAKTKSEHRPYLNNFKNIEPLLRTLITNKAYSGAGREIAPEIYEEMYESLLKQQSGDGADESNAEDFTRDYRLALLNHIPGGCFFITETGFYGISEDTTEVGDHLAIWFGGPAPFVLKPIPQSGMVTGERAYSVRGVAYVAVERAARAKTARARYSTPVFSMAVGNSQGVYRGSILGLRAIMDSAFLLDYSIGKDSPAMAEQLAPSFAGNS